MRYTEQPTQLIDADQSMTSGKIPTRPAPNKPPKKFAFWSPKGGCGKTTLSCQVATMMTFYGWKVAFFDLDHQRSAVYYFDRLANQEYRPAYIYTRDDYDRGVEIPSDVHLVILDCPPTTNFVPPNDFTIIAPTRCSGLDIHAYVSSLDLVKNNKVIKVLNDFSTIRKLDEQILASPLFKECVVVSGYNIFAYVMTQGETLFDSHALQNRKKANNQIKYLIGVMSKGQAEVMNEDKLFEINLGDRLKPLYD